MRKTRFRNIFADRRGAALMIVAVITMVLVMLSLSLLLAAYSLFDTTNKQSGVAQCHELALSLSETLGDKITELEGSKQVEDGGIIKYVPYTALEFKNHFAEIQTSNPLWYYLRCNILQGSNWPYYDDSDNDLAHSLEFGKRVFTLTLPSELNKYSAEVEMYWVSDAESAEKSLNEALRKTPYREATVDLVVTVNCSDGVNRSSVTSKYALLVNEFGGEVPDGDEIYIRSPGYNTNIYYCEDWSFRLQMRR